MSPRRIRWLLAGLGTALALAPTAARAETGGPAASLDVVVWEFIRASGLVAYGLLSVSVFMGLSVRARALDALMKRAWAYEAHQFISLLALTFTALHLLLLRVNGHVPFGTADVLVPFVSDRRPVSTALGIVSAYLTVTLAASSYLRGRIGQRAWRLIHYGGFAAWALALVHGVAAGSDSGTAWVQYLYLGTGSAVLLLLVFRAVAPAPSRRPSAAVPKGARRPERREPAALARGRDTG